LPQSPRPPLSLNLPRLYAIVDADACASVGRAPIDVARAFLGAGARLLQLRFKAMASGPFLELARTILADANTAGATVIVNDRADITALANAPGLHVGQSDLSPADARAVIGPSAVLGLSTHTRAQWEQALAEPISYAAIGPVFGSATKQTGYEAIGLAVVREMSLSATAARLPTVAIGGITIENAASVIDAGATSVAVIIDLLKGDPEARCRAFIQTLK
jgi:thiamine-phosphate pyrophosphorylase